MLGPISSPSSWLETVDSGVLKRGRDYVRRDLVTPLAGAGNHFQVQGSELYHVKLDEANPVLSECDCPHADGGNLCKHVVAAWLTRHEVETPSAATTSTTSQDKTRRQSTAATRTTKKQSERQADLDFLHSQGLDELREWIAGEVERNEALARQLNQWRLQTQDVPRSPAQWRSFVTGAMPARRGMYGRQLERWTDEAQENLQLLATQLEQQPALVRDAVVVALQRLYKTWETADDSYWQLWELYTWLLSMIHSAVKAEPPPASWLKKWVALLEADPVYSWSEKDILADAGPVLRRAYADWAIKEWKDWCALHPDPARALRGGDWSLSYRRSMLRKRYLWAMAQEQDLPTLIQTMRDSTIEVCDWTELIEFCRANGQDRLAFAYAETALKAYPSEDRLRKLMLELFQHDGWDEQAMELAQQRLDRCPADMDLLQSVLDCAAALGVPPETAFAQQLERVLKRSTKATRTRAGKVYIDIGLRWLLARNDWQAALELYERDDSEKPGDSSIYSLAMALPASHHAQAVTMLESLLHEQMLRASSPYKHEVQMARAILQRVPAEQRNAWLDAMVARYQRRTRLVTELRALLA